MFCIPKIDTQYACDFISLQILLKHFKKKISYKDLCSSNPLFTDPLYKTHVSFRYCMIRHSKWRIPPQNLAILYFVVFFLILCKDRVVMMMQWQWEN